MTTSTQPGRTAARPRPSRPGSGVLVGERTFRQLKLQAGLRPFAVVAVDPERDRASGWLMPDPAADAEDPLLKELGVQAQDRRKPCYITVPTDWLR